MVKKNLKYLGLITSEEKCVWKPTQKLVWCWFKWNTETFRVKFTEKKMDRLKKAAQDILEEEEVEVKKLWQG
jgi:hypothetical protein